MATKKKLTTLEKHYKSVGSKGGKALFAKVGSGGMRDLVNRRWKKEGKKK